MAQAADLQDKAPDDALIPPDKLEKGNVFQALGQRPLWAIDAASVIVQQIDAKGMVVYRLRSPLKTRLTLEIADALVGAAGGEVPVEAFDPSESARTPTGFIGALVAVSSVLSRIAAQAPTSGVPDSPSVLVLGKAIAPNRVGNTADAFRAINQRPLWALKTASTIAEQFGTDNKPVYPMGLVARVRLGLEIADALVVVRDVVEGEPSS